MIRMNWQVINIIVLASVCVYNIQGQLEEPPCPIGFELVYTRDKLPLCYRLKNRETFAEKFDDCSGNLFSFELCKRLIIPMPVVRFWSDYKNIYPGGHFVDWSYTELTGKLVHSTFNVLNVNSLAINQEYCLVINYLLITGPVKNFTAVSCNEKFARLCIVEPYKRDEVTKDGCEAHEDSWRFSGLTETCLAVVSGDDDGTVRPTWKQAKELCEKRDSFLLGSGWRYANHPILSSSHSSVYPLGIDFNSEHTVLRFDNDVANAEIPESEWHFKNKNFSSDTSLGAVGGNYWHLVNKSYIFYDVICENSIQLKSLILDINIDPKNKILLSTSDTVNKKKIYCLTDSNNYSPEPVKTLYDETSDIFVVMPKDDGYYWCISSDSKNHSVAESNKALFIREKLSLLNTYAVKIKQKNKYQLDTLKKSEKIWKKKLKEYVFYGTKYAIVHGENDTADKTINEDILKTFVRSNPGMEAKDNTIMDVKTKRIYLDARTALVHIELNPEMKQVPPGTWDDVEIISMKPVYYCKGVDSVPTLSLGESNTTAGCRTYTCTGDFNEGVQWLITSTEGCIPSTTSIASTSVEPFNEVSLLIPTVGTMLPEVTTQDTRYRDHSDSSEESTEETIMTSTVNTDPVDMATVPPEKLTTISRPRPTSSTSTTTEPPPATEPETTSTIEPVLTTRLPTQDTRYRDHSDSSEESTEETIMTSTVNTDPVDMATVPPENLTTIFRPRPTSPTSTTTEPPPATEPETTSTIEPVLTTRLPPQSQLQQAMDILQTLLNDTAPISVADIDPAIDQVDGLLSESENLEIPGQLLYLLDDIGARLILTESEDIAKSVRPNVALLVTDTHPEMPVRGLRIIASESNEFIETDFQILRENANSSDLSSRDSELLVQLPSSVVDLNRRISFVVFRTDRAFQSDTRNVAVNSRVLSVNVEDLKEFPDGEVIDIHFNPFQGDPHENLTRVCAFWQFLEDGTGHWSDEGCTFIPATEAGMLDTCRCNHLTHFAEILMPRTSFADKHEYALQLISVIGCCMSIFGLLFIGLTAILFRSWRKDFTNKIWLQLCLAIFILIICFLIVVYAGFEGYSIGCMFLGVILHYSTLASFCWMLAAAVLSYRRLVMVFTRDASHRLLKAAAFSWGAPLAVVAILLSVNPQSYAGQFEGSQKSGAFCYPSGLALWLSVYAPIVIMLLANWTLFIIIVRSVFASTGINKHGDSKKAFRCASVSCLLVFLFGLPWLFGLFPGNIVTVYLFVLTATFQGFVLFVFFVLGNKKTRDLWLNKLMIKQTRKIPVTSDTYTNRSTGNAARDNAPVGLNTIESRVTKPKSLASTDNSRFS